MYGHWFIIYKKGKLYLAIHMKYVKRRHKRTNLHQYTVFIKTCFTAFKEQHHIHSAGLANRKGVNTNWHYYKFHFKLGINKTQPILEPSL